MLLLLTWGLFSHLGKGETSILSLWYLTALLQLFFACCQRVVDVQGRTSNAMVFEVFEYAYILILFTGQFGD